MHSQFPIVMRNMFSRKWLLKMNIPYTGWPRKNATTLIVNFKDIINKTELIFILLCGKFIFQQNDTMIINFG